MLLKQLAAQLDFIVLFVNSCERLGRKVIAKTADKIHANLEVRGDKLNTAPINPAASEKTQKFDNLQSQQSHANHNYVIDKIKFGSLSRSKTVIRITALGQCSSDKIIIHR